VNARENHRLKHIQIAALRLFITIMIPVLLVLTSARLVMSPVFLWVEYQRPGFPADYYGFTTEDRLRYAPYAVNYLLNGEPVSYLGNLTFENGRPLFNGRELGHMRDVKAVTQAAFANAVAGGMLTLATAFALWRGRPTRGHLRRALRDGGVLTISIVLAILVTAALAWDVFFTGFHTLFFSEGTWVFLYSDTLIRLFPEQFWFDAAVVIGGLTTAGAAGLILVSRRVRTSGLRIED